MDYFKLSYLLALQEWLAADQETERLMLAIAEREGNRKSWITSNFLENFPCDDLCIIDHLWVKFSNGRFGFSVQQRIYEGLVNSGKYDNDFSRISEKRRYQLLDAVFFNAVGWTRTQDNFIFDLQAPIGHLPTFYQIGNWHIFFSRVQYCLGKSSD
ncbi:MAG: serine/threonine kinase [Nostocales cyanobacterium]|nr:MAG: serine/threonine kinase [Nostocales cyanobacterium]TAF12763.1 MAG: serine/threonine kinase [Nostocales cyanobacterium]